LFNADAFDFEGVHDLHIDTNVQFLFTGNYNELLAQLNQYTIVIWKSRPHHSKTCSCSFTRELPVSTGPQATIGRAEEKMLEITVYEVRRNLKEIATLSVLLSALAGFTILFFPSVKASGGDLDQYIENLPPAIRAAFGFESLTIIEGFLAAEFYQFAWVLLLGMYVAYRAGSLIAGDIESGRIDIWLAAPDYCRSQCCHICCCHRWRVAHR